MMAWVSLMVFLLLDVASIGVVLTLPHVYQSMVLWLIPIVLTTMVYYVGSH
jgi:hypothetical protein